ncbi:nucleotide pyrophosphohydrolase [Pseudoduganella sp. FT55W]|uniref:Nucleotide pyrophosphohydrolase n=1 Tax=Duganella rivi TaxID=2666083 RepID=A0A7X4KDF6_9BURK|nr:nucleotide pyrophosphohydrolase [Duganella rivi]MYM70236.1 nucleotide pyrophosphohydrolase [Duganella rivi]
MTSPPIDKMADLQQRVRQFAYDRDWQQFHTPKNLAMALVVEAAELAEHFQWLHTGNADELKDAKKLEAIRHELADVLLYLVLLADKMDIELYDSALEKLDLNSIKYPVQLVRGDARKYNEY